MLVAWCVACSLLRLCGFCQLCRVSGTCVRLPEAASVLFGLVLVVLSWCRMENCLNLHNSTVVLASQQEMDYLNYMWVLLQAAALSLLAEAHNQVAPVVRVLFS